MINQQPARIFRMATTGVLLVLAVYIAIYLYPPPPALQHWKGGLLSFINALAAGFGTYLAFRIYRQFAPAEPPRAIWNAFTIALAGWTCAELIWTAYLVQYGNEMPEVTPGDFFWLIGYGGFALALLFQYEGLLRVSKTGPRRAFAIGLPALLLIAAGITLVLMESPHTETGWLGTFISIIYPLADLGIGVAALFLARVLGNAQWARPWLALLVFMVSDLLFTWLFTTNLYIYSGTGNLGTIITDTLYLSAYLLIIVALTAQLLLLRHGTYWLNARQSSSR